MPLQQYNITLLSQGRNRLLQREIQVSYLYLTCALASNICNDNNDNNSFTVLYFVDNL